MSDFGPVTPPPARLPAAAVFLGALASEVNEPDALAPAFATIADITERLVAAVRGGGMPEVEAAQYLQALRLTDDSGTQWCVGATSLRWYRKTADRGWKLAVPPETADGAHQGSLDAALSSLPAHVMSQLGGSGDLSDLEQGYGLDPFAAQVPASTQPWEFELGEDRARSFGTA